MFAVIGLGYGDEGKGTITEALAVRDNVKTVSRFSGGAQALHHVVLPDGRWHGFSQFTSGTFHNIKTFLGRQVIIAPDTMLLEAEILKTKGLSNPMGLVQVHPKCRIATPWHRWVNKFKEIARGSKRLGTCGMGIGETVYDQYRLLRAEDCLRDTHELLDCLETKYIQLSTQALAVGFVIPGPTPEEVYKIYKRWSELVSFESAEPYGMLESSQGTLIDPKVESSNHKTKLPVSVNESKAWVNDVTTVGVIRSFMTRHGNGLFPTETVAKEEWTKGEHNHKNKWQGSLRFGYLDFPLIQRGIKLGGKPDFLAVTCLDRIKYPIKVRRKFCSYIEINSEHTLLNVIETELKTKILIVSYGPTIEDKIFF